MDAAYLTIDGLAARLGVHRNTIKNWIKRGLPVLKIGRTVRIPTAEAEAWLRTGGSPSTSPPERLAPPDKENLQAPPTGSPGVTGPRPRIPKAQRRPVFIGGSSTSRS